MNIHDLYLVMNIHISRQVFFVYNISNPLLIL